MVLRSKNVRTTLQEDILGFPRILPVKRLALNFHLQTYSGNLILESIITEGNKQKRQSWNDPAFESRFSGI